MFNPDLLYGGITLALSFKAVLLVLIGTVLGVIIGAIPGLGPLMGIILLLPVVISLTPVEGVGLLMAIFVGGSCGGAISAILLGIPGTPLAAATLLDGHPMAKIPGPKKFKTALATTRCPRSPRPSPPDRNRLLN